MVFLEKHHGSINLAGMAQQDGPCLGALSLVHSGVIVLWGLAAVRAFMSGRPVVLPVKSGAGNAHRIHHKKPQCLPETAQNE
jgi:hypothetical protein